MKRLILALILCSAFSGYSQTITVGRDKDIKVADGKSLIITDLTGVDTIRIFDDGDTTRITSNNPIKIGLNSLIISLDGSLKASGGSNSIVCGIDATNFVEIGHEGINGFTNLGGAGNYNFKFEGITKATFTPFGHLHLFPDVDLKHTLRLQTSDNDSATGIAWENSDSLFTGTIYRNNVGSGRADLIFAAGFNTDIDLLTNSFIIHGSDAEAGKLEVVGDFQITSGSPGAGKVLTSHASGNATWVLSSGGGWTDGGTDIFLTNINDNVGIGEAGPDTKLHVSGGSAGTITPAVGTQITIENSANTYLSILSPNSNERGIFFGEPSTSLAGAIIYNNSTTTDGLQFRTNGNNTRMVIAGNGRVGIGTEAPSAPFEVVGAVPGNVGGFASGMFHVRGDGTAEFSNSVITGHSSFSTNTQLWYFGSVSSSNNNIAFINRQNAELHLHTNNTKHWTMEAAGNIVLEQQLQIKGGSPGVDKVLTSDANGLATWETVVDIHIGGNFVDTIDQTIGTVSVGQAIRFTKTTIIDDITHTTDSTFTINTSGVYDLIVAPQLAQGSGSATVEFWIEKNGVNIAHSNVQETIAANSESLPLLRWKERFVATDVFKIIWASNSTNSKLDNITSTYGGPNIPSIMLGVTFTHD